MTSSIHSLSDNSQADEQPKHTESHVQHSSPAGGVSLSGIASPTMHYAAPAQIGVGNAQVAYPYPDPYYRSIFAPYDTQPYAAQSYPAQPMVHLQLMGIQQGGVPLPSEAVEEPVFVNAKQYHGILRRRQSRAKAESENKLAKSRKVLLFDKYPFPVSYAETPNHDEILRPLSGVYADIFTENKGSVYAVRSRALATSALGEPKDSSYWTVIYMQPYLHESRHLHALRRARGVGGRFQKKNDNQKSESESSERSQDNINPNHEKDDSNNASSGRCSIDAG